MNRTELKPSDVLLIGIPLTDVFGKCELEIAAAYLVRTCQVRGDEWVALLWTEVQDALRTDLTNGTEPFASLVLNPIARPDLHGLVASGWAKKVDNPEKPEAFRIELTPAAIERIGAKWARRTGTMVFR